MSLNYFAVLHLPILDPKTIQIIVKMNSQTNMIIKPILLREQDPSLEHMLQLQNSSKSSKQSSQLPPLRRTPLTSP